MNILWASFTYSSLEKVFQKQIKTIEDQIKNSVEASKVLKEVEHQQKLESIEGILLKDLENSEIKNERNEIKKLEEQISRNDLKYESSKYKYDFAKFETVKSFGYSIFSGKIAISKGDKKQSN